MGRRSINTTKSGKYMNPTDQARKEARKKELKKNKKQRQMVRAAVLKGKDPTQLIQEMEKIDQMEFNVVQAPPLNEKVLKDKRKKLLDTFNRVARLYQKEEPEKYVELRQVEVEYEKRRNQLITYFESVRNAETVQVDEIPLPNIQLAMPGLPSLIPLPLESGMQYGIPGILKRTTTIGLPLGTTKNPPGIPAGLPPELSDDEEEKPRQRTIRFSDDSEMTENKDTRGTISGLPVQQNKAPGYNQQRTPGQDIDSFMKEMEQVVHRQREMDRKMDPDVEVPGEEKSLEKSEKTAPPNIRPPGMMYHPPPHGSRAPPPPPLGMRMPPLYGIRLPPGPPPGLPRMMRPPGLGPLPPPPQINPSSSSANPPNVLSAGPQLINRSLNNANNEQTSSSNNKVVTSQSEKKHVTIEAKPQLRNLSTEVTRFLPTALRVKREEPKKKEIPIRHMPEPSKEMIKSAVPGPTKDDAYMQFMHEMQGLL